ncbi:hypothetical protein T08_10216 [Trichinella sp. T8]|nr:hypothetical protein T08_10216 [Trichinella sp. T8]
MHWLTTMDKWQHCNECAQTLKHITERKDSSAASKAQHLRVAVCRWSFVILLAVHSKVLPLTLLPLKILQESHTDFLRCCDKVNSRRLGQSRWRNKTGHSDSQCNGERGNLHMIKIAVEEKCICSDYWKTVSAYHFCIFLSFCLADAGM